jgi:hypothetical protein
VDDAPNLYALSLTPPTARPGETVRLLFCARNLGSRALEDAHLRFVVPAGLEPLGEVYVALGSVAPDAELRATLEARVDVCAPAAIEPVYAVLEFGERRLASNRCPLTVRGRPILDGPSSGVRIVARDAQTVRVDAVVTNEGDGAARDLRLVVAAPLGTRVLDDTPTTREVTLLEPGAAVELGFDARIVAPLGTLRADDAFVLLADGTRYALRAEGEVRVQPLLVAPVVALHLARHSLELVVELRNDGWTDAADLALEVRLPPGLREIPGTLRIDDAEPVRRARGEPIAMRRVPARGSVRVTLRASVPAGTAAGTIEVRAGEHTVTVPFARQVVEDLRLRLIAVPATATPGEPLRAELELHNAGDLAVRPELAVEAPWRIVDCDLAARPLACGAVARAVLTLQLDALCADGSTVPLTIYAAYGTTLPVRADATLVVRERPWLALDDLPERDGDAACYVVRHVGTTPAHAVRAQLDDRMHDLGTLLPGERTTIVVAQTAARCGGVVRIGERVALVLPPLDGRPPARVDLALDAPAEVVAGTPFPFEARCTVSDAVETLTLRLAGRAGVAYVAGSTVLDGVALLDRGGDSPLAGAGLIARAIAPGTTLHLRCAFVADAAVANNVLELALDVDGEVRPAASLPVAVIGCDGFAARPSHLAYHVEACALASPAAPSARPEPEPEPCDPPFVFVVDVNDVRRDLLARALRGAGDGLASHLLALRALFPAGETSGDPAVAAALGVAGEALADVFDRLYVKLRIPGFEAAGEDLEDAPLRAALDALCARLLVAPAGDRLDDGRASVVVPREVVRTAHAALAHEAYGAPEVVRFLLALVPDRMEDALLASALGRWVRAARATLTDAARRGPRGYDEALARGVVDGELDDARAGLLAALRARVACAGAVG